ncbi:tripartite motif-containing protein 72-like [Pecten maximus]|uniref:tripartite motif-containing protein 72-like n=1 Tax=Pecten maximus TaxID=6579 RepID=UPI0014584533|nr:tripartite motif-containing protein 72-like [Pecten maximus]
MATAIIQTAEDQITCTICFEIFKEPKALPCLHTFCKRCISKFITERKNQHGDTKGYMCPICRRPVAVPTHIRKNPETWADQLENNHVVSTMIDAYQTPRGKSTETCMEHPEKELEFFCVDHTKFICSMCSLQHRRCSDVITREDARFNVKTAEKIKSNTSGIEYKQTRLKQYRDLHFEQCNTFEHIIDRRGRDLALLDNTEQMIRDEIISTRKRITELLNKHEEKALTRLAKMKSKRFEKIQKDKRKLESHNELSRENLECIQKMMDSNQKIEDAFIESIQSDYKSLQRIITGAEKKNMQEMLVFTVNPAIETFISKFDSLGKLSLQDNGTETNSTKPSTDQPERHKRHKSQTTRESSTEPALARDNELNEIKLPFRGKPSWITGIAMLPTGRLLLVDHNNETVSVYGTSFDFLCKTDIHPAPYDVVSISSNQDHVMVSIPDAQQLIKCEVLQDGFVEVGQKMKTNYTCKALASDGQHVAVCSSSEIQIFETDGEVWMVVLDESYSRTKFTYVTLTSPEKKVFVSDQTYPEPNIRCIDFNGATLWKVSDGRIGFSTGICVIGSQLMVTSWDAGKILTLSFNGLDLETFNESTVLFPWKLYASSERKTICVSQYKNTLSDEDKRTIKVLHIP